MIVKDFISKIQDYYGQEYRIGTQIDLMIAYLNQKSEKYLTCLFAAVVKEFSGQYKTLPDIAVLEKVVKSTYEIMDNMQRKQNLKTPAITDGEEVDYSEEMKALFAGMDKKLKAKTTEQIKKEIEDENNSNN